MSNLVLLDPEENNIPVSASSEWQKIIDDVYSELAEEDLPETLLKMMEYLITGYPVSQVAKKLDVSARTIRSWLVKYPSITVAIKKGQENLSRWRMGQLEKQFIDAAHLSAGILEGNVDTLAVDPKILAIQARQARYVLDLYTGKLRDVHITQINNNTNIDSVELKATQESLNWLAQQMSKITVDRPEVLEGEYRVSFDNEEAPPPLVNEDGEPPYGEYGKLDATEEGILCHVCGSRIVILPPHIQTAHKMTTQEYENAFRLQRDEIKNAVRQFKDRGTSQT